MSDVDQKIDAACIAVVDLTVGKIKWWSAPPTANDAGHLISEGLEAAEDEIASLRERLEKAEARAQRLEKALTAITDSEIGQRYSQIIARAALAGLEGEGCGMTAL